MAAQDPVAGSYSSADGELATPAMLRHGQVVDGTEQPGRRSFDAGAASQLAPQAQQRLLDRVGGLLIGQALVASEVVERRAVVRLKIGQQVGIAHPRLELLDPVEQPALQARHIS